MGFSYLGLIYGTIITTITIHNTQYTHHQAKFNTQYTHHPAKLTTVALKGLHAPVKKLEYQNETMINCFQTFYIFNVNKASNSSANVIWGLGGRDESGGEYKT